MLSDAGIDDHCDENVFIAATCKQKGIDFLLGKAKINGVRKGALTKTEEAPAAAPGGDGSYSVTVNGRKYAVDIKGDTATVNGKSYEIGVADGTPAADSSSKVAHESADSVEVAAPMNAKVVKVNVGVGDHVSEGDVIFVVEAMKMEIEVKASVGGTISSIAVAAGEQVTSGQAMASIN
jgi:pyruvate carboxylase subunit B